MNELVKFNTPELQGVEKSKAEQIKATFEPMAEMLSEFEDAYNVIISDANTEITKAITLQAKQLRVKIAKIRIATEKTRKTQKEEYLRAGKAIDGVSNILKWAVTEKENKLKEIEDYFEIQEQKRKEKLQAERAELLSAYVEDAHERDLVKFEPDEFAALLSMKKKEQEDRIAAEEKAKSDRIEREKAEAEERERIRKENEKLRKEAEEREKEIQAEREKAEAERKEKERKKKAIQDKRNKELMPYVIFIRDYGKMLTLPEIDYQKELTDIKEAAKQHYKHESEKKRIKAEKEEAERIERERLQKKEAELKAKQDAERKEKEAEAAKIQAELNKGDADKVKDLISDLENLKTKYSFKSDKNKKKYADTCLLIDKVIAHIKK